MTIDDLSKVIERKLDINIEEAKRFANIVMDLFGFEDRIIDNILEQRDRQLFYLLEANGLLNTEREEITLHNGRRWRIHYWILKKPAILKHSQDKRWLNDRLNNTNVQHDNIYSYLSKDIWTSRKNSVS